MTSRDSSPSLSSSEVVGRCASREESALAGGGESDAGAGGVGRLSLRTVLTGLILPALFAGTVTTYTHRVALDVGGNLHDSLAVVWKLQDPSLFPRDPFVAAQMRQPTLYWDALAWVIPRGSDAPSLFRWGPVAVLFLYGVGMGLLAMGFTRNPWAWATSMIVGMGLGDALVGSNYLMSNQLSPTTVVVPALLAALGLGVSGRIVVALALCGALANVHLLNAAYVGAILCGGAIATAGARKDWTRLGLGLAAAAVLGAPTLRILLRSAPSPTDPEVWSEFLHLSHPIHYGPLHQEWFVVAKTAAVILLLGSVIGRLWRVDARRGRFLLGAVAVAVGGFLVLGSVAADWLGWPAAVGAQPIRAVAWLMPLAVAALATALFDRLDGEPVDSGRSPETPGSAASPPPDPDGAVAVRYAWMAAAALLVILNEMRTYSSLFGKVFAIILVAAGVLSLWPRRVGGIGARVAAALAGGLAAFVPVYIALFILGVSLVDRIPGLTVLAQGPVIAILAVASAWVMHTRLAVRRARGAPDSRRMAGGERMAAFLFLGIVSLVGVAAVTLNRLRGDQAYWMVSNPDTGWDDVCRWVRANTAPDALIQGPPAQSGLRTAGRRNVFVEMNDDSAVFLDPSFLDTLTERLAAVRAFPAAGAAEALEAAEEDRGKKIISNILYLFLLSYL